jgi:hypothetical protein
MLFTFSGQSRITSHSQVVRNIVRPNAAVVVTTRRFKTSRLSTDLPRFLQRHPFAHPSPAFPIIPSRAISDSSISRIVARSLVAPVVYIILFIGGVTYVKYKFDGEFPYVLRGGFPRVNVNSSGCRSQSKCSGLGQVSQRYCLRSIEGGYR